MRVYVQVKQLGKRKCNIEKIPVDFPVPPVDVQGLIEAIVSCKSVNIMNACNKAKY